MTFRPALKGTKEKARLRKNATQSLYSKRNYQRELERAQAWRDANREHYNEWYRGHYAKNKKRILAGQRARRKRAKR